jgi:LysR family pca operon transcriptional activator
MNQRIKLRHLSCFLEVAARRSFHLAAETLHLSQPAISKAIAELEDSLGTPLFERSRRGVFLTPHGEAFRRYAGATMTALRQGIDTVAQGKSAGGYTLSVGLLPSVAAHLMPMAVEEAKRAGLAATLRLIIGQNNDLLAHLRSGALDLVVGRLADAQQMHGLAFEHLYSETVVAVARRGHPLAAKPSVTMTDLLPFTVLVPTQGSVIRPFVDRLMITQGISALDDVIETVSPTFGRRYTLGTDAVWIISHGVVIDDLASGELVRLGLDCSDTSGPIGLTTKADVPAPVSTALLINAIRAVAARMHGDTD